ncbi:MAG: trypsin-like peptidase domain-containing protein [Flavobacteriales bacterium]
MKRLNFFLFGLFASIGGATCALWLQNFTSEKTKFDAGSTAPTYAFTAASVPRNTSLSPTSFTAAAAQSLDAVVHVKTLQRTQTYMHPWFEAFGYGHPETFAAGSGSGVIIDGKGIIVTNNHVISGAESIEVSLNNNRSYAAEIIGTDPSTDLALLKIQSDEELPIIPFGSSDAVEIGEWVLAVGNPLDLTSTVTAGIVSAKTRSINLLRNNPETLEYPIESFIQTDAAVNPGNSGGALVNTNGELIGINTAIASKTGSYTGYSFAIPSSIVQKVAGDLLAFGEVRRAYLGIQTQPLDEALAEELNAPDAIGCAIVGIIPTSGADDADLQINDIIRTVNGMEIINFPALQECIAKYHPGDRVELGILRDGQAKNVQVQLKNREGQINSGGSAENTSNPNHSIHWIEKCQAGLTTISESMKRNLNIDHGLQVAALGDGKFSRAGIQKGFIITKINGDLIEKADQVQSYFIQKDVGLLIEGLYPNGKRAYYGVGTEK